MGRRDLRFHDTGRIEGTNNRLGVLKRVAYGFVKVANFAARALLATPGMPHHHDRGSKDRPTSTRRSKMLDNAMLRRLAIPYCNKVLRNCCSLGRDSIARAARDM